MNAGSLIKIKTEDVYLQAHPYILRLVRFQTGMANTLQINSGLLDLIFVMSWNNKINATRTLNLF